MYIFYALVFFCFSFMRYVTYITSGSYKNKDRKYDEKREKIVEIFLVATESVTLTVLCGCFFNNDMQVVISSPHFLSVIFFVCLCLPLVLILFIPCEIYQQRKNIALEKRGIAPIMIFTCIAVFFFSSLQSYLAVPCPLEVEKIYAHVSSGKVNLTYEPVRREDETLSLFAVVNAAEHILPAGPERDRILEAGKDIRESAFWTLLSH